MNGAAELRRWQALREEATRRKVAEDAAKPIELAFFNADGTSIGEPLPPQAPNTCRVKVIGIPCGKFLHEDQPVPPPREPISPEVDIFSYLPPDMPEPDPIKGELFPHPPSKQTFCLLLPKLIDAPPAPANLVEQMKLPREERTPVASTHAATEDDLDAELAAFENLRRQTNVVPLGSRPADWKMSR